MKKFCFIVCAMMALALLSCEKDPQGTREYDPMKSLPENVVWDFYGRYPEATDIRVIGGENEVKISLIDKDGYKNEAVYVNGEWTYSQKSLDVKDFLKDFPKPVRSAYVKTGIAHEYFYENNYVLEIERAGMAQKQYEVDCLGYYVYGDELIDDLVYHIVIAEDGTLLSYSHRLFNQSIWWADLSPAMGFVLSKYPDASILGAANDGEQYLFIRHEGILKTVTFRSAPTAEDFEWRHTEYALPMDTMLPAHVRKEIKEYEAENPGQKLFELSMLETIEGFFYGLKFGTELDTIKFYVGIDEE